MDNKELETLNLLHFSPVNVNEDTFDPTFPIVHYQLVCLAHSVGEVVVLAPYFQVSDLLLLAVSSLLVIMPTIVGVSYTHLTLQTNREV